MSDPTRPAKAVVPFDGDLLELKTLLEAECRARPGKWASRLLAGTDYVGMRLNVAQRRWELWIGREATPVTLGEQSRWEARVRELQRNLRCLAWQRGEDIHRGDSIAAVFEAPIHHE